MTGRRPATLLPVAVALITIVAFLPALGADFVSWDDERNFLTNPHFRGLGLAQLKWMWTTTLLGHYVPISWMTLGADYVAWGMSPRGYHLTNILIHAANAVVVFFLARRILTRALEPTADEKAVDWSAGAAALLFAVHPLRVESVAWITERRDVVSGFFGLLSVLFYLKAMSGERFGRRDYAASLVTFTAALLSKGTAVTVPAVLAILCVYPLRLIGGAAGWRGEAAKRAFASLIPYGVPAAGFVILSIVALHPPDQLAIPGKLAVSAYSLAFYLAKTVLPTGLSPLYQMPTTVDPVAVRFWPGYVVSILYLVTIALSWKRRPGVSAALLAFGAISLPMLGIVQNGPQIAADRYTYHAAPALAILAGAGLALFMKRGSRTVTLASAGLAIGILGALTWRQTGFWKNSETLWKRVLDVEPNSALGNSAWANILYKQDRVDEAIEYSRRAVEAAPQFAEGHNDLGVGLARKGALDEAIERYRISLSLKPRFDEAEANWGVVLAGRGQLDSALAHYRRALADNPDNPDVEVNWGNVLVRQGRPTEAVEHYRKALWIRPDHADAHLNWGVALATQGQYREAADHFSEALRLNPNLVEARQYLARATELARGGAPPR